MIFFRGKKAKLLLMCLAIAEAFSSCSLKDDSSQKKTVPIPGKVERIAVDGTSLASVILLLGAGEKIVASLPSVRENPWFQKTCPAIQNSTDAFAGAFNPETLLKMKPDMAILWSGNDRLSERLRTLGIPVLSVQYRNSAEFKDAVSRIARSLGATEMQNASRFFHYYDSLETLVRKRLKDLPEERKKRVYYAADSPTNTEGRASSINTWISVAGGVNAANDSPVTTTRFDVDTETLIRWNPDIIITRDAWVRDAFLKGPAWQNLKAVRSGKVYVNPKGVNSWATRSGESALQFLWAAKTLYPDRFQDVRLSKEVFLFYSTFYRYSPDSVEIAGILQPGRDP